ncbi:MAG: undecaprenyl/decaprenyl-phosphate alpha-N-acetylglucosaminyl 1-phosphate transferase, partial [Phycisphaerae bacterium]|nr:undecaprenyl/decaprenyl-phosphate alpha-N-acetylglucosaminyl 1-phosphate transferase [Phycisphaerae bacterium]
MHGILTNPYVWLLFPLSLAATAALTPLVITLARRLHAVDPGGYRRVGRKPIPLLGGLAVAAPVLALFVLLTVGSRLLIRHWEWVWRVNPAWLNALFSTGTAGSPDFQRGLLALAAAGLAMAALGVADDMIGLRARTKLAVQILAALFLCWCGYTMTFVDLPFIGTLRFGPFWGAAVTVLWLVGLTNAFNIMDGLDGLATGIGLIAAVAVAVLGGIKGNIFVMVSALTLAGSLAAFLCFNFPPARVFLGDTGSLFTGFMLAGIALMGSHKSQAAFIFLSPVVVLALPIAETFISMARRLVRGRPVFSPDAYHTHHRL